MENAGEILRKIGEKITEQREAILQAIIDLARPVSADELYEYLLTTNKVGRTTIYRTLELFEKKNLVRKVLFKDGIIRYESNLLKHHHHLVCLSCGKILPLDGCFVAPVEGAILKGSDFLVTDHYLELYGYCAKCRRERER
ncbi:MAG TPA: Fur family transcriptional regulator [bacterium]|nr:Fur family transcriptional regulator [bacterium]HPC78434.1 Fur family transcriptional regulator [bacterium]HPO82194.1 Fur family transcriptional regulator [bacterium]HRR91184.1 Fur family transcriptional regulator [bacterium]